MKIFIRILFLFFPVAFWAQHSQQDWFMGRGYDSTYEINIPATGQWKQKLVFHGNGDSLAVFDAENCIARYYAGSISYPDQEFKARCNHYLEYNMKVPGDTIIHELTGRIQDGYFRQAGRGSFIEGHTRNGTATGFWKTVDRRTNSATYAFFIGGFRLVLNYVLIVLIFVVTAVFVSVKLIRAGKYPELYYLLCALFVALFLYQWLESDHSYPYNWTLSEQLSRFTKQLAYLCYPVLIALSIYNLFARQKTAVLRVASIAVLIVLLLFGMIFLIGTFWGGKIGG